MYRAKSYDVHRLPAEARRRLRLPVLLLTSLLLNVLVISLLTIPALRGQRAMLDRARETTREQSLALLGNEVEHVLKNAIQAPFFLLKNIRRQNIATARLELLRATNQGVDQVIFLDSQLRFIESFPPTLTARERLSTELIVGRAQEERNGSDGVTPNFQSFVENWEGQPTLFAFQAGNDMPELSSHKSAEGWILLRFNVNRLITEHVSRLLRRFARDNHMQARLIGPEQSAQGTTITLSRVLPGWLLIADTAGAASGERTQEWAIMGVGAGAVIAIVLTMIAIGWEVRREHALVDLRNRFLASVSHELKTPLALIRMYVETLYLERQPDAGKQREYLGVMLREAERLTAMIDDVLTFTKLRTASEIYQLTAMDIAATVTRVVDQYRAHFAARGLDIDLTVETPLRPVAHDPNGITQVVVNLLDNAAKYANSGGRAEVRLRTDDRWIDLTVVDYGEGLVGAERARIMRALRRGDMLDSAQGSGLGLALVEFIAVAHGAHFILDQAQGHSGVRATLSFPAYREQA